MSIDNANDGNSRLNNHVTNEDYNATKDHEDTDNSTNDGCTPNERTCAMTRSHSWHYYYYVALARTRLLVRDGWDQLSSWLCGFEN